MRCTKRHASTERASARGAQTRTRSPTEPTVSYEIPVKVGDRMIEAIWVWRKDEYKAFVNRASDSNKEHCTWKVLNTEGASVWSGEAYSLPAAKKAVFEILGVDTSDCVITRKTR